MRNDISDNIKTGKTLKYFRKRANLKQKDVAKSMLKSQQWVSDTENGVSTLLLGDLKRFVNCIILPHQNLSTKKMNLCSRDKKGDDINDYTRMLINTWIIRYRKSYRKYNRYGNKCICLFTCYCVLL